MRLFGLHSKVKYNLLLKAEENIGPPHGYESFRYETDVRCEEIPWYFFAAYVGC
jgi:hypothetical protein